MASQLTAPIGLALACGFFATAAGDPRPMVWKGPKPVNGGLGAGWAAWGVTAAHDDAQGLARERDQLMGLATTIAIVGVAMVGTVGILSLAAYRVYHLRRPKAALQGTA